MDEAISHIRKVADATDEAGRARIQNALRELQFSLETPYETMVRLSVDVSEIIVSSTRTCFVFSASPAAVEKMVKECSPTDEAIFCCAEPSSPGRSSRCRSRPLQNVDQHRYSLDYHHTRGEDWCWAGANEYFENLLFPVSVSMADWLCQTESAGILARLAC
jgi:hypothetical protein